jgi:hypothetical protein
MELILHFMYVVAIKDSRALFGDTPMELCMIGLWNLIIIWLKVSDLFAIFIISDVIMRYSYYYPGDSSDCGHWLTECTLRRIWLDV